MHHWMALIITQGCFGVKAKLSALSPENGLPSQTIPYSSDRVAISPTLYH
jgi:hypothetical protein